MHVTDQLATGGPCLLLARLDLMNPSSSLCMTKTPSTYGGAQKSIMMLPLSGPLL
jgi:hypothetical protein